MDWFIVAYIVLVVIGLFYICCAMIEEEIKRRREAKRWQDWADKDKRKEKGGD